MSESEKWKITRRGCLGDVKGKGIVSEEGDWGHGK